MAIGMFCHTPEADQLFDGPVSRSFDRREHLDDVVWQTLGVSENQRPFVEIEQTRFDRIATKIIAGLYYVSHGSMLPDKSISLSFSETELVSKLPTELINVPFNDSFAPDFTFRNNGQYWHLLFFGSFQCVGSIESLARNGR